MEIREKYDDLYTLILNLEMTIKETDIKEVKEELENILYRVQDDFKEVDEELEEIELAEVRQELNERYGEYRQAQGF